MGINNIFFKPDREDLLRDDFNALVTSLEGDIVPRSQGGDSGIRGNPINDTYSLGTSNFKFKNLFLSGSVFRNGKSIDLKDLSEEPKIIECRFDQTGSPNFLTKNSLGGLTLSASIDSPFTIFYAGKHYTFTADIVGPKPVDPTGSERTNMYNLGAFSNITENIRSKLAGSAGIPQKCFIITDFGNQSPLSFIKYGETAVFRPGLSIGTGQLLTHTKEFILGTYAPQSSGRHGLYNVKRGFLVDSNDDNTNIPEVPGTGNYSLSLPINVFLKIDGTITYFRRDILTVNHLDTNSNLPDGLEEGSVILNPNTNRYYQRQGDGSYVELQGVPVGIACQLNDTESKITHYRAYDPALEFKTNNSLGAVHKLGNNLEVAFFPAGGEVDINIYGKQFNFKSKIIKIKIAGNLINEDETTSLKDDAEYVVYLDQDFKYYIREMDSIIPLYRRDLGGWYHPTKGWRAVGGFDTTGSGNIAHTSPSEFEKFRYFPLVSGRRMYIMPNENVPSNFFSTIISEDRTVGLFRLEAGEYRRDDGRVSSAYIADSGSYHTAYNGDTYLK